MKHLKIYEGFLHDLKEEFARMVDEKRKVFDDCLFQMIEDYGLEFQKDSLGDVFVKEYLCYCTDSESEDTFQLDDKLIDDVIKTVKRLKQFEEVDVEGTIKISHSRFSRNVIFSTDPWYKNGGKNQRRYLNNINDIKAIIDEQARDIILTKDGRVMTKKDVDYSQFKVTYIEIVVK